mgnify:CR=1 FL=1
MIVEVASYDNYWCLKCSEELVTHTERWMAIYY